MNISEQFEKFSRPGYYSRVDNTHILDLFIGLDEHGRKSIELRSRFVPLKVSGTSAIDVTQYKKPEYNTIRFSLKDDEVSGLFYKFCDDIIEQTRGLSREKDGYKAITGRFFQWKKMFVASRNAVLTEPAIMGLIGELLFLKDDLSLQIGPSAALRSWSGQELTRKDFSVDESWYEVKAISRGNPCVRISSLEQLSSEHDGELVIYALEKMSAEYNGITLNKLVLDTLKIFSSQEDKDLFMTKVSIQGYEYNNYYDDFVFELSSKTCYTVNKDFPKLTPADVPRAITKVSYDILLTEIMPYIIKE